jgi:hypothetical protein
VPAEGGLGDQVLVIQLIELTAGLAQAGAVQGSGSIDVEGRSRDQAESAEQPLQARTLEHLNRYAQFSYFMRSATVLSSA